jgi:hypothetical protein
MRQGIGPRWSCSVPVRALAKGLINGLTIPDSLHTSLLRTLHLWDLSMLALLAKPLL